MINEIKIPNEIFKKKFKCNLQICKGACCTTPGGLGAPLKKEEIEIINSFLPEIKYNLSAKHIYFIEQNGFFDLINNNYSTKCFKSGECVFVYFENEIAFCAIEKTFLQKKINFQKPISCALFPVRLKNFNSEIELEYFDACDSAFELGEKENLPLNKFLNKPLNSAILNWDKIEEEILQK